MKLLIISPLFPYPLESGGNKAQFLMIDKLRERFEISLACPVTDSCSYAQLHEIWPDVHLHVMRKKENIPAPHINLFQKLSVRLSNFLHHPADTVKRKTGVLPKSKPASLKWPCRESMVYTNQNIMHIDGDFINFTDTVIRSNHFDMIQVEFINYISLGFILPENTIKLFVHHEIGFVRMAREIDTLPEKSSYDGYLQEVEVAFELNCLKQYDAVITFSDVDKNILQQHIPTPVYNSPFPVEDQLSLLSTGFSVENIVFLGGESHYPNLDALHWFLRTYDGNKFPSIQVKIIGKWSDPIKDYYKELKYVEFMGFVDDMSQCLKNSIMIVPLRIGSGIRTKILEMFQWGVPVISTTIGMEGIRAVDKLHYFRADTIEEFENVISIVSANPEIAAEAAKHARLQIAPEYSIDTCAATRENMYKELFDNKSIQSVP